MSDLLYASCSQCGTDLGVLLSGPATLVCEACVPTSVSGVVAGPATSSVELDREMVGRPV